MSWCSKWLHGSEWPEGVEVTLGHDGNVRRYVPEAENEKLRELFADFWAWADPPFALKSGTFEQFMAIVDRARELRIEVPE